MIIEIFNQCALLLLRMADALDPIFPGGMTYEKINVIIFCMIGPIVFLSSVSLNVILLLRIRKFKKKL